jgi:hypothetical protein
MGLTSAPLHFARYKLLAPKSKSPAKKQDFVEKMGLASTPLHFARYKLLAPKSKSPAKKQDFVGPTDMFSNLFVEGMEALYNTP